MKRRDFLRSAGAATLAPLLPLPAMANPAAAAPVNAMQVGWAALFARVNDQVTPALLQKWMRVTPDQATALMQELAQQNIIHFPATGPAVAVKPMYPNGKIPGAMNKAKDIFGSAKEKLDLLKSDDAQPELPASEDDSTEDQANPRDDGPTPDTSIDGNGFDQF